MAGRVDGKVAFITGAARGQGRSHAVRLAEEGADIIAVDICRGFEGSPAPPATPEDLAETARLAEKHGGRVVTFVVDVRDAEALAEVVNDGVAELGGLDASVANAGVLTVGTWDKTTSKQWRTVLDVNLIGTWNTCAAALPHLVERGGNLQWGRAGQRDGRRADSDAGSERDAGQRARQERAHRRRADGSADAA